MYTVGSTNIFPLFIIILLYFNFLLSPALFFVIITVDFLVLLTGASSTTEKVPRSTFFIKATNKPRQIGWLVFTAL